MKYTVARFDCLDGEGNPAIRLRALPGFIPPQDDRLIDYFKWAFPESRLRLKTTRLIDSSFVGSNDLKSILVTWKDCSFCGLAEKAHKKVFFRGALDAPIVIIGEGPGEEEDKIGIPFVGRAGNLLDFMLEKAGYDLDTDVLIINPVLCRPTTVEGKNRPPSPEEVLCCVGHAVSLVQLHHRSGIVFAGKVAASSFGNEGKWNAPIPGGALINHPSYFLHIGAPNTKDPAFANAIKALHSVWVQRKRMRWGTLPYPVNPVIVLSRWKEWSEGKRLRREA